MFRNDKSVICELELTTTLFKCFARKRKKKRGSHYITLLLYWRSQQCALWMSYIRRTILMKIFNMYLQEYNNSGKMTVRDLQSSVVLKIASRWFFGISITCSDHYTVGKEMPNYSHDRLLSPTEQLFFRIIKVKKYRPQLCLGWASWPKALYFLN